MPDLLTDALPTVWEGRRIDPDFRHMVRLVNAHVRGIEEKDDAQRAAFATEMMRRFYRDPVPVAELPDAFAALFRFHAAAEADLSGSGGGDAPPGVLPFDYAVDAAYIIAAFRQLYGIDLTTEPLHWWLFRALLRGCIAEDCLFARIVRWRTADTTEMSAAERQHTEEMRARFALPPELKGGAARAQTLADHEAAFLARFEH